MFALCVVSNDEQAQCRTINTKKEVWVKYKVQASYTMGTGFLSPSVTLTNHIHLVLMLKKE
jgi:hypothetical protein